ncbi:enoyl-ACP reductase-like protein [Mucilaginibacter frigoritolerans]|uniref:Enoyl-ACP reductase-like protein n=1 Tax=Mucilaginibacter frigoritolerans TaxID=652788 RepID=A0A562U4W1_9SPHI|nr:SDR family oxidoreductase [Mucilaginibacter frigoritolerans]TWJ00873.1 enoyl-ACP reductase-like protein [Mucilaginibacter frigoritolerans]
MGGFIENLANGKGITTDEVEKQFFQTMRPTSLLRRFIEPDEIASLVTYLASDLSIATNGAAVRADGGVIKSAF